MFTAPTADKSLERHFKFPAAIQPGLMTPIAGTVNVASPNALKTHQNVRLDLRTRVFQLIGKSDRRTRRQVFDQAKWPLVRRPLIGRDQSGLVAKIDNPLCQS